MILNPVNWKDQEKRDRDLFLKIISHKNSHATSYVHVHQYKKIVKAITLYLEIKKCK